jgi:hypothetical protein
MTSMTKLRWGVLAGRILVLLAASQGAFAQESASTTRTADDFWMPRSRIGLGLMAGGGVAAFSDEAVSRSTGVAGTWNLRVTSGTRLPFAWEVAYLGGANDVTGPGLGDNDYMVCNTLEGSLRFNLPLRVGYWTMLEPFALAGMGWSRYNLVNSDPAPGRMDDVDDQLTVPLGVGLVFGYRGFTVEARGSYRFAFDDEMFGGSDMGTWNASMSIGAEF